MLIYSGQPIRTTLTFDEVLFDGRFIHTLPNGAITAVLNDGYGDEFGIHLDADEWDWDERVTDAADGGVV